MRQHCKTVLVLVYIFLLPNVYGLAQEGPRLNYIPGGSDVDGRTPMAFTSLRQGLFVMIDPLNNRAVVVNSNGKILGASDPLSFVPTKVKKIGETIQFTDTTGDRASLSTQADPLKLGSLQTEKMLTPAKAVASKVNIEFQRSRAIIRLESGVQLTVRPVGKGDLTNVSLLGQDQEKRFYVQTSQIIQSQPSIIVGAYVQRFSPKGKLSDIALIPLASMDTVPDSVVALEPSGTVSALVPSSNMLYLQPLSFQPAADFSKHLAPASVPARVPIDANIDSSMEGPPAEPDTLQPAVIIASKSRAQILKTANDYLNVNWTLKQDNFSHANVESKCSPEEGKYWERPTHLTDKLIGKPLSSVPYCWGGFDTVDDFGKKLYKGKLAGSICTCREKKYNQCIYPEATGVDCSGFVSRCWGLGQHVGTNSLSKYAKKIKSYIDLLPGDALVRPGHHVRLFIAFKHNDNGLSFGVLESTTKLSCEGVCRSWYSTSELSQYQPIRFKGVQ